VLLIGANDLLADYGIAGKASHPLMLEALETVARAAREAGLAAGVSGLHEPAMLRKALELGFRFIGAGTDLSFLMKAGREKSQALRQLLP
jgi:2-keto-3-deoxy-L-rhamnonate aldolase RhmA